jgi:hypothetical protein
MRAALQEVAKDLRGLHDMGDKRPSGPSLKLLNLIERKGLEAVI